MCWINIDNPIIKGIYINDSYSRISGQRYSFAFTSAEDYYDCIDDMPSDLRSYISTDDSSCTISVASNVGEEVYTTVAAIIAEHDGHQIVN